MALPTLEELEGPQRDGTAQAERPRSELAPGAIGIDERSPAELIAFARRFASHLLWYDEDNEPAGWWARPESDDWPIPPAGEPPREGPAFFDGIGPGAGTGPQLGYDEVASVLGDAAKGAQVPPALLKPHMALFLAAVRMMEHGQRALNEIPERHLQFHLRDVLRLEPRRPVPDCAYVLFELAAGVRAAEAPAGLRLLGGRDSGHRDRIYRLDSQLVVNRARVERLASTFVERETVGLADAQRAIVGTSEEQFLFLISLALGEPNPGDPLPPLLGKPVDVPLLKAAAQFVAFARPGLFLELFELRSMLDRKALRSSDEADWSKVNKILEAAGRKKRDDTSWQLVTSKPSDFYGNLALALGGKPDLGGLTEVESVDDLLLHLDRDDVREAIASKLFMDVNRQFVPMISLKRSIEADWRVVNLYLELAGARKRKKPEWAFRPKDPAAFADNLAAAIGTVDYSSAGPVASGVVDPDSYLARIREIEAWSFLSAEESARIVGAYGADDRTEAGERAWRDVLALLASAHARKARSQEAAHLRQLRLRAPIGRDGRDAELEAALGPGPGDLESRLDALGRYVPPEDAAFLRSLLEASGDASAPGWDRADSILADARRRRLRLPEPVAQKTHWRALWALDDSRSSALQPQGSWRCFGGIPPDAGPARPPAAIGWAIASPVLAMSEGRRRIILTLGFRPDGGGPLLAPDDDHSESPAKIPFGATLSSAKGWIEPGETSFAEIDYRKVPGIEPLEPGASLLGLQVTLTLDEAASAIAPSDESAAFGATDWPVLRLMLRPVWDEIRGRFDSAYERFRSLKLERVHVAGAVGSFALDGAPGLWPLQAETETGAVNAKKPFEPFGPVPSLGSEVALSHRDLLHKKLDKLRLSFEWLGGPDSLSKYYEAYGERSFTVEPSLVDQGVRTIKLGGDQPLFSGDDSRKPVQMTLSAGDSAPPDPVVEPLEPEARNWRRFLVLRLAGTDFGHHRYPSLISEKSVGLANALKKSGDADAKAFTVNPPWTPKLKRIGLDFTAAEEVRLALYDRESAIDRLFHVHPFGVEEARASGVEGWPLLPSYEEEGALYIGLSGVAAPQSLSLLFAGTEGGGAEERSGPVRWSYLDGDEWKEFLEPPEDGTMGLVRRGIVRFDLPRSSPGTIMPAGFYWLRAAMAAGAVNACDMIDVHAQAGSAHFVDDDASPDHYLAPLPKQTIRGIADPVTGIARVIQPYPTSGGRPAEATDAFRTRASERLRHKGRALSMWDYERLVLDRFPDVHKVKCLPARLSGEGPGTVRLVVIPDIRGEARRNPFAPRAPNRLLDEIAAFLGPLAPPTAAIEVGHARFVQVRVRLGVRFRPGGDEDYDKRRLADEINRYLAPWAFDQGSDIAIGQRIDATSIVAFVDSLPFVDFVGTCRLFSSDDGGATFRLGKDNGDRVEAGGSDEVLAPAPRHEIDLISDEFFEDTQFTGVGYMQIELDFVVN